MLKKITASILASIFIVGLMGCNTMAGAGKDIEKGGEKIKDEAQEHKSY